MQKPNNKPFTLLQLAVSLIIWLDVVFFAALFVAFLLFTSALLHAKFRTPSDAQGEISCTDANAHPVKVDRSMVSTGSWTHIQGYCKKDHDLKDSVLQKQFAFSLIGVAPMNASERLDYVLVDTYNASTYLWHQLPILSVIDVKDPRRLHILAFIQALLYILLVFA